MRRLSASCAARPNRNGINLDTQQYTAYGTKRGGGTLPTDHAFTGQKRDGTGLLYYNARYYDPVLGQFVSPDSIVPDPSLPPSPHDSLLAGSVNCSLVRLPGRLFLHFTNPIDMAAALLPAWTRSGAWLGVHSSQLPRFSA